jgi:NAD(P)H-dependent flavin oxidoreductase YrpB (nitropropane dioxygenase family)
MVEEYVDSVDDDDSDDEEASGSRSDGQVATLNEDGDMERDKWGQGLIESNVNPITMAKDMVVSFVRKAASSGYNLINGAAGHNSTPAPCRNTTAVISVSGSSL